MACIGLLPFIVPLRGRYWMTAAVCLIWNMLTTSTYCPLHLRVCSVLLTVLALFVTVLACPSIPAKQTSWSLLAPPRPLFSGRVLATLYSAVIQRSILALCSILRWGSCGHLIRCTRKCLLPGPATQTVCRSALRDVAFPSAACVPRLRATGGFISLRVMGCTKFMDDLLRELAAYTRDE